MKKLIVVLGMLLWLILTCGLIIFATVMFKAQHKEEPVHLHAGFIIVKDDEVMNLNRLKYMKFSACTDAHEEKTTPEEEQLEKAHLHDLVGNVVHVHRKNATWGDLFTNLGLDLHSPVGFVDGYKVENIEDYKIKSYERVVIFENSDQNIDKYFDLVPTEEKIIEVEQKGESC